MQQPGIVKKNKLKKKQFVITQKRKHLQFFYILN